LRVYSEELSNLLLVRKACNIMRLKQLGLTRLERRRVRSDLIETLKTMNGEYDLHRDLCLQLEEAGRR